MEEKKYLICSYCKKTSEDLEGNFGMNSRWLAISHPKIDIFLCEICMVNFIEIEQILISQIEEVVD